jgi:hypothetical protein
MYRGMVIVPGFRLLADVMSNELPEDGFAA